MRLQVQKVHGWLFAAIIGVAALPMVGSFAVGRGVPPLFGVFPPNESGSTKPGFNWAVFGVLALVGVLGLSFLLKPSWFGFNERGKRVRHVGGSLPWWFWGGTLAMGFFWYEHWFGTASWVIYTFVPLWWGLIFAIDGLVYKRTGGRSLFATHPDRLLVITVVSIAAWAYFEFINFYAMEFWVYPRNQFFSPLGQAIWYLISFTTVLPALFEWYTLLHTFDGLWNRYAAGPPIRIPQRASIAVLVVGLIAMIAFGAFPHQLFVLLWVGPPLALTAALAHLGFWTPFRPIAKGVWSHVVLAGIASLANGFFWELWNHGSEVWRHGDSMNPNYWFYEIPYVDVLHPFSEMPLLGYAGYLPFGGLAWVCWLTAAHLLSLEPDFDMTRLSPPTESPAENAVRATFP